ncbi:MAG TPA: alpha-1,4-glucan--maltose-1-phosphate maltosyltransferase [Gaiellales bacterium]|nr:alpha-1,4-glucan--maltose-1-phosphate maltosyltransferase [Gaiellales bacterium]
MKLPVQRPDRIRIERIWPQIDAGRYPVKRTLGERVDVWATLLRDGHEVLGGALRHRAPGSRRWREVPLTQIPEDLDRWHGSFAPDKLGRWQFGIVAWVDRLASWRRELERKVAAGQSDLASELSEGAVLLGVESLTVEEGLAAEVGDRSEQIVAEQTLEVLVDAERAAYGSWYELFPRSWGGFAGVEKRLPEFAELGFDVLYFPPVHPIGVTHRKGRNNAPAARRSDPGSPWAIGGEAGGHSALNPDLGTPEEFARLTARAAELGISIALDFAIQCSPDHPWLREHPDWFHRRPDGTLKYAENPPKRYQDIYNINFDTPDWQALWTALRNVVLHWAAQGVTVFRVDNPHTKPVPFWEWLIAEVQAEHPETVFLAEAFTRPAMMALLAKAGFSQSYTYFTWRNTKAELTSYMTELTRSELPQFFRPNFFANTPDILHHYLVAGGRPAFEARLVLAATLSPSYGIYSGFERCENLPLTESSEEYLNSEKYELKKRSLGGPLLPLIGRLNAVRRANPALQQLDNITFLETENEHLIAYVKRTGDNAVIACVNLDPAAPHEGVVVIPPELGLPPAFDVSDLLGDATFTWRLGPNYVRLEPGLQQAHLLRVEL